MRTKKTVINAIGVALLYLVKTVLVFITKTLVIRQLGDSYNGIDGLFTSIISMLSVAELGVGSAIVYNLYEPVKKNDYSTIKSIIYFYKKCYRIIGVVVLLAGLLVIPMVPDLIGDVHISDNIILVYIAFLADSVCTYFYSYKQSIFIACQENYIISIYTSIKTFLLQLCRILIIIFMHNYLCYVSLAVIFGLGLNLFLCFKADRKYPYLKDKDIEPLSPVIINNIKEKVKGLLFHKIGGYIVLGTDNILISKMTGVITVGLYSNYILIVNTFEQLLGQMLDAVVPSLGNFLLENDKQKNYTIYRNILFLCHVVFSAASIVFCVQIGDFISIWIDDNHRLGSWIVYFISLNFYSYGMRKPLAVFENASGTYYSNRFVPIAESITNLVVSVILAYYYGLAGIIIGTAISSIWIFLCDYPVYIWKNQFNKHISCYFADIARCILEWNVLLIFVFAIKNILSQIVGAKSILIWLAESFLLTVVVLLVFWGLYKKKEEFIYYKSLLYKLKK